MVVDHRQWRPNDRVTTRLSERFGRIVILFSGAGGGCPYHRQANGVVHSVHRDFLVESFPAFESAVIRFQMLSGLTLFAHFPSPASCALSGVANRRPDRRLPPAVIIEGAAACPTSVPQRPSPSCGIHATTRGKMKSSTFGRRLCRIIPVDIDRYAIDSSLTSIGFAWG